MGRKFVLATKEVTDDCWTKAKAWLDEPDQLLFHDCKDKAATIVAEFLANEKGFTLYVCNASYGKIKD